MDKFHILQIHKYYYKYTNIRIFVFNSVDLRMFHNITFTLFGNNKINRQFSSFLMIFCIKKPHLQLLARWGANVFNVLILNVFIPLPLWQPGTNHS